MENQGQLLRLTSGPNCGVILPPRGQLQYLDTFLVIIIGIGVYVLLASMVGAKDAAKHTTMHSSATKQSIWS